MKWLCAVEMPIVKSMWHEEQTIGYLTFGQEQGYRNIETEVCLSGTDFYHPPNRGH